MAVEVAVAGAAAAIGDGVADDATAALIANTAAFVVRHGGDVAESKLKARTAADGKLAFIFPQHPRHKQYQQHIKRLREQDQTQNQSLQPPQPPPPVAPPDHTSSRAPLLDRLRTHLSSSRNGATSVPPLPLLPLTIPVVASSLAVIAAAFIAVNGEAHSAALASSRYADALTAAADAQNPHGATHRSAIRHIVQAATDNTSRNASPPPPQTHFDNVLSRVRRISAARTRDGAGDGDSNIAALSARRIVSDVDWSHFVVLHRVDFVAAERMYLPPNATNVHEMQAIAKQNATQQHADTTAATSAPSSSSSIYERCVTCHELILVSEMSEHLRIEGLLSTARTVKPPSARSHIVTDTQLAENIVALFPSKRRHDENDKQSADQPPNKISKTSETATTTAAASLLSPSPTSLPTSVPDVPVPFTLSVAISAGLVSNAPSRIALDGVARSDTVDSIKSRIAQQIGVTPNKIKLSVPNTANASASVVFLNRERSTLAEYDITADAVLTAAIKERGRATRK